ncbi:hypothetical protein EOL73_05080 [Candidatus Saccharibacteria bacterium]|nr:hypothetical protein [Candidatus Saccharibacteria bacterium]
MDARKIFVQVCEVRQLAILLADKGYKAGLASRPVFEVEANNISGRQDFRKENGVEALGKNMAFPPYSNGAQKR